MFSGYAQLELENTLPNLTRYNKAKHDILDLGHDNYYHQYKLRDEKIEHSAYRDLTVLEDGS